jgi:predicted metal-dependent enzyme (double-stranded beta helix superfamily)
VFDLDELVAGCQRALHDDQPMLAVKELVERAVSDAPALEAALPDEMGVQLLHLSDELTVASVVIPAGSPASLPHDHRMWAVVGVYGGQEDNQFYRRAEAGLQESNGRSILAGQVLAMGAETVHAISNPSATSALAALHVYGGDLVNAHRSMWVMPDLQEKPYDDREVLRGGRIRPVADGA